MVSSNLRGNTAGGYDGNRIDHSKMGPARLFAGVFGVAYLGVALTEVLLGLNGSTWGFGGMTVLMYAPIHNIVHWVTGAALLGVLAMGRWPTKLACRTIGFAFAAVFLLGILTPEFVGMLMGHGGEMPLAYNLIHATTGGLGLLAGFTSHAQPYMVRHRTHRTA